MMHARLPQRAMLAILGMLLSLWSVSSLQATVVDSEKPVWDDAASVKAMALSSDGRLLAVLDNSSKVRLLDTWTTATHTAAEENLVDLSACTDTKGIFVTVSGSSYLVHVPCKADGKVYQFTVSEAQSLTSAATLEASTPEPYALTFGTTTATSIQAADLDVSGKKLYLAVAVQALQYSYVISLDVSSLKGTVQQVATSQTAITVSQLAWIGSSTPSMLVMGSDGTPYYISSGTFVGSLYDTTCPSAPRDIQVINDTVVLLLGEDNNIYNVAPGLTSFPECTKATDNWGLSGNVASLTRLQLDGDLSTPRDVLLVRGAAGSSTNGITVYSTPTTPDAVLSLTALSSFKTEEPPTTADILVAGALGQAYLGGATGVYALSAGPWLQYELEIEPIQQSSEATSTFTISITPDEPVDRLCYSLAAPKEASIGSCDGPSLTADVPAEVEIDPAALGVSAGFNQIFLYAFDGDGNIGWTSFVYYSIDPPGALSNVSVTFGNEKLYLSFDSPADDLTDYTFDLYIATSEFTITDENQDLSTTLTSAEFSAGGVNFPDSLDEDNAWPASLAYDDTSSLWKLSEGVLTYAITPLDNTTPYWIVVRPVNAGVAGPWSAVVTGTPEETCGAACLSDQLAGSCSACSTLSSVSAQPAWGSLAFMLLPVGFLMRRRSRAARD